MGRVEVNRFVKRNIDYGLPYWANTASKATVRLSVSDVDPPLFEEEAEKFHQARYPAESELCTMA